MKIARQSLMLVVVLSGAGAHAEVRETSDNAFVIESSASTVATPAAAYTALGRVAAWWDPQHTWSGSSKNLSLQMHAGGCFCEKLADGGSVQHGQVLFAQPGKLLRLDSALGPLQQMAVTGVLTFKFTPEGSGTLITMNYRVAGAFSMESAKLAAIVDQVLAVQLARLRTHSITGKPVK